MCEMNKWQNNESADTTVLSVPVLSVYFVHAYCIYCSRRTEYKVFVLEYSVLHTTV